MIKFFRRFRQQLLTENKFSKYLLYAFGEIVLVVIGILIALQINNWNENRKQNLLEADYYCRLLEDLEQDLVLYNALINQSKERLVASNQAVRLLQQKEVKKTEIGKQIWLAGKAIYIDFKPNESSFEDLKSSNLNIIKDKKIIKALNTYYNSIESIKSIAMINGKNAVDRGFSHDDGFANGDTQASMLYGRFKDGLDRDVYNAIEIDTTEAISSNMKNRLYNDALFYTSSNIRQLELYNMAKDHAKSMITLLTPKCQQSND